MDTSSYKRQGWNLDNQKELCQYLYQAKVHIRYNSLPERFHLYSDSLDMYVCMYVCMYVHKQAEQNTT